MNKTDVLLKSLTTLVASNGNAISSLGAKTVVLTKLIDATFPHLTASQCTAISKSFRNGIEDAMSLMDDLPLPADYHSAVLEQTNMFLIALDRKSTAHG